MKYQVSEEVESTCYNEKHDWMRPYEIVGGCKENPGVWSKGGTTLISLDVCCNCGKYRKNTYYGSQRNPGDVDHVTYLDADEKSLNWIENFVPK